MARALSLKELDIFVSDKSKRVKAPKNLMETARMQDIVSLCKRRGFVFPGSEIYGGLQAAWDYGPLGVEVQAIT